MSAPLVAVVTPAYNGGAFLRKTLACVQAQTYPNLVHVILDNASKDETVQLIEAVKTGPVPIVTRRNAETIPQVANWNAAMGMTPPDAKYVKLLCADDLMRADCIAKMVNIIESDSEIDFVTAIDVINDSVKPHCLDPNQSIYMGKDFGGRLCRDEIRWFSAAHMFFRASPDRLHNPFAEGVLDAEFILRALLSRKMAFIFEPLLFTRYHEDTVTAHLGGGRHQLVRGFRVFQKYAPTFLSREEFVRAEKSRVRQLLRHVVAWQMQGDTKSANTALQTIADFGISPTAADYASAIASWPVYKLKRRIGTKGQVGNMHYGESDFLPSVAESQPA